MVFEKPMKTPPVNWNISEDKLLFLEETNASEIFLVKLFKDKKPILFKFTLPSDLTQGLINSKYDHDLQNFIIERDSNNWDEDDEDNGVEASFRSDVELTPALGKSNRHASKQDDMDHMWRTGEYKDTEFKAENRTIGGPSVSQCFNGRQLINRAPDKMIDFFQDFIILAYRENFLYLNVTQTHIDQRENSDDIV